MSEKVYIGDGIYAQRNPYDVMLTTEDGGHVTNTIYIDPVIWVALREFMETDQ